MKPKLLVLLAIMVLMIVFNGLLLAQTTFTSITSGDWNTGTTWNQSGATPTSSDNVVIVNGHTVSVAAAVTIAGTTNVNGVLQVNTGGSVTVSTGTLNINNGGTYQHNINGGIIPTATWATGSTCLVTGVTTTAPTGASQTFYNFTWNCPSQGSSGLNLGWSGTVTVNGDFTVSSTGYRNIATPGLNTSTYVLRMCPGTTTAAVTINGNLNVNGDAFLTPCGSTGSNVTVDVKGNVTVGDGTNTPTSTAVLSISNNGGSPGVYNLYKDLTFNTNTYFGKSNSTTNKTSYLVFKGGIVQTFTRNGTVTFSGAPGVQVVSPTTLVMGTSVYDACSHCFWLEDGASIVTANANGLATTGSINCTAANKPVSPPAPHDGNYFSTLANYKYNGSGAQATGALLPTTVNNLTIDNSAGVTLASNATVNGMLTLTSGNLYPISYAVTIGPSGSVSRTNGYVGGTLKKTIPTGAAAVLFEVGSTSGYSPISFSFGNVSVSDYLYVRANESVHPNATTPTEALSRYWSFAPGGSLAFDNYSVTMTYLPSDFHDAVSELADEAGLIVGQYSGGNWYFPAYVVSAGGSADGGSIQASGLTTISDLTIGKSGSLPVELSGFTAQASHLNAELKWSTATETNNFGFDIERKASTTGWSKIGFVTGAGTSTSLHNYSYTDNVGQAGTYEYRIKQIDKNGASKYSSAMEVELGAVAKTLSLGSNYPNPFNPSTSIEFSVPNDGRVLLKVYNMIGQEVATLFDGVAMAGTLQKATFNASRLPSGVYFSRMEFGGTTLVKRMMLVK